MILFAVSDVVWNGLIAAAVPYTMPEILLFIGAISAGIVAVINAVRSKGTVNALAAVEAKVDTSNEEVGKVHKLTNDRATKQDELNVELQNQIKILITTLAAKDQREAIVQDRQTRTQVASNGDLKNTIVNGQKELEANVIEVKADVKEVKAKVVTDIDANPKTGD